MDTTSSTLPSRVVDGLIHQKDSDLEETVVLPITRYQNVMSGPNVVGDSDEIPGAPFHLLKYGSVDMSIADIRRLVGGIL